MIRARRVLFVCEGNLHRSPTAEAVYAHTPGLAVRSAGVAPSARTQLTAELLAWADVVFVMERRLGRRIRRRFGGAAKAVVCLDVPDDYQRDDPALVEILRDRLTPHLGPPGEKEDA